MDGNHSWATLAFYGSGASASTILSAASLTSTVERAIVLDCTKISKRWFKQQSILWPYIYLMTVGSSKTPVDRSRLYLQTIKVTSAYSLQSSTLLRVAARPS
jgi:hypothetical protein